MEKYLYFCKGGSGDKLFDAAHDVAVYPVSSFRGFTNQSTTETHLAMCFKPIEGEVGDADGGGDDVNDVVTLTITANKHKEVMLAIADALVYPEKPVVTIFKNYGGVTEKVSEYISSFSGTLSSDP